MLVAAPQSAVEAIVLRRIGPEAQFAEEGLFVIAKTSGSRNVTSLGIVLPHDTTRDIII
jgi:hypothetical protein